MKKIQSLFVALAAAAALAGCSSTPVATDTTAAKTTTAPPPQPTAPSASSAGTAASTVATVELPAHKDPKSPLFTERSVYFDYDDFAVKPEYNGVIERHGKYLQMHAALSVRVEGNADERGSAEYNLSLGQRRAEAVEKALKIYGVKDTQMEAVSYGKERPKALGHDEAAWAQNRRADIVYRD